MPPDSQTAHDAPGSFRDPQGHVITADGKVFRSVIGPLAPYPGTWADGGPLTELVASGKLVRSTPRDVLQVPAEVASRAGGALGFLEHPRIDPVTYPYEWPFELLKRAALLHLDVHRSVLNAGLTLADGSAFNVQFHGTRPVFIDALAFVPLTEGEAWAGYTQFCESFLNPLLLAVRGCDNWMDIYRGRLRGVPVRETARQLGFFGAVRHRVFIHVYLQAMLEGRGSNARSTSVRKGGATKAGLDLMLQGLQRAIYRLEQPHVSRSEWFRYEDAHSYTDAMKANKQAVVTEFVARVRPRCLLDLGSNAGEYADIARRAGAVSVIGLERDAGALQRAVVRGDALDGTYLPLQVDLLNPSPSQGWQCEERSSLRDRISADGLLCLALVHHLVLGAGIPLPHALRGICTWSRRGLIEFVPADDPMAVKLTSSGSRMLHPYDLATFRIQLSRIADIVRESPLPGSGRVLFEYVICE